MAFTLPGRDEVVELYRKYVITSIVDEVDDVVVARAEGARIWDVSGKVFIDAFSGIGVANIGHGREEVVEAVIEQVRRFAHVSSYYYYVPIVALLAKRLAEVMPSRRLVKSFFGNSGAEANECALKLARKYTRRFEVIALAPSFHGRTLGTLSVTGQGGRKRNIGPLLPGVIFVPAPYCFRAPFRFRDEDECAQVYVEIAKQIIENASTGDVAAMIVEPVLGEPGIIPLPKPYIKAMKEEVLDKYGALLIADEVQTGFGRTGRMFGIEHFNVEPDIVTTAKALGGGLPLGACTTREEIADAFKPGDHFSTFGGNPVSAAAALAALDIIVKEDLSKQAEEKGQYAMKRLRELAEEHRLIGDVRGLGLFIGIELIKDERKTPATKEAKEVKRLAREMGVLLGIGGIYGNVVRIQPPLVITKEEIDTVIDTLDKALKIVEGK